MGTFGEKNFQENLAKRSVGKFLISYNVDDFDSVSVDKALQDEVFL